jgi:REP element-mobilizing transposase RayT
MVFGMSRKLLNPQSTLPYHVTGRCINREWFSIPMDEVWQITIEQLYFIQIAFGLRVHAFTLMNNHFHLIISSPQLNLSEGMRWFMKEVSRQINYESNRINQVWGGRFFRSLIPSPHYFLHAYKYVYRNSVEAGISTDVLSYKYSTLRGLVGGDKLIITVDDNTLFDMGVENCLAWLNRKPKEEDWDAVGKAMKKGVFELSKCKRTKKALLIENDLL